MPRKNGQPTYQELYEVWESLQTPFQVVPIIERMLRFILEVGNSDTPLMTKMIVETGDETRKPLVLIWATSDVSLSPLRRIEQLLADNKSLKGKLETELRKSETVKNVTTT